MSAEKLKMKKVVSDKICRMFNLVFNQVSMYNAEHPAATRSIDQFYDALTQGLKVQSPLLLMMNREQFFIEEEPFDAKINTSRMAVHFKKTEIQSLSFEKGVTDEELKFFIKVFSDTTAYPNAENMKTALAEKGLNRIKINYVFYKKMTEDDDVVDKTVAEAIEGDITKAEKSDDESGGDGSAGPSMEDILEMMAANVVFEEFEKTLSIQNAMNNPREMSRQMIAADLSTSTEMAAKGQQPGHALTYQLQQFREQVDAAMDQPSSVSLTKLAEGVYDLKQQLLEDMEAQKKKGVVYIAEDQIREEADEITDKVLIHLIVDEYSQGSISIRRLAQIMLRLVPETGELQRILPKLKTALLGEGMPLSDFLQLVQELKNELQSDELSKVLEESAEQIGLDPDELIAEVMDNPGEAAELITLAAEIRKGSGDEKVLSDILVNYVEQIGTEMATEEAEKDPEAGGEQIYQLLSKIRSKLVGKLREKNIDTGILNNVESRLVERMEESVRQLQSSLIFRKISTAEAGSVTRETVFKLLSEKSENEDELRLIMDEVKKALLKKGVEEEKFQAVFEEILGEPEKTKSAEGAATVKKAPPRGTLNRASTLFILEKEILRANRYETPFSALSFSATKVIPKQPVRGVQVSWDDVIKVVLADLAGIVRETDLVGLIDTKMIMILQPMTGKENAKLALGRITRVLKTHDFLIKEIPFEIKFAGVVTAFEAESSPSLKSFLMSAQTELLDLSNRLSNIQDLM